MTDRTAPTALAAPAPAAVTLKPVPLHQVLPWLAFAAMLALGAIFFVGVEQGATSVFSGTAIHEWTHDARHLLGFPCH